MSKKSMKRTDKDDDINGSDLRFKPSKKRFLAAANTGKFPHFALDFKWSFESILRRSIRLSSLAY